MTTPRFIQIHTLHAYPSALLNRDDAGLAKRLPFGGAERVRISSQCLKRHWRKADDAFALARIDPEVGVAVRSRRVWRKIEEPLLAEGFPTEAVGVVLKAMQNDLYGESEKAKKNASGQIDLDRGEVVVLGWPEIRYLTGFARDILKTAGPDVKPLEKAAAGRLKEREARKNFHALRAGAGIDAAMFGRFVSGDRDARVDAAVHVAHAFTVHAQESEPDYFTAVDDLPAEDEGAGAGHLNTSELTSGVYYGYVVVDVPLLVSNLESCERSRWLEADRTLAARTVEHLLYLIAKVTPGAKLGATAPYGYASLVLVEAGEEQPRSLANAFIEPVRARPFDRQAALALATHVSDVDRMYESNGRRWLATRLEGVTIPEAAATSFPRLVAAVGDTLRAGSA